MFPASVGRSVSIAKQSYTLWGTRQKLCPTVNTSTVKPNVRLFNDDFSTEEVMRWRMMSGFVYHMSEISGSHVDRHDDGGSKQLWNVRHFLRDYKAQHPRRQP
jgi:hypothetical protein